MSSGQQGSARGGGSNSLSGMLSTAIPSLLLALAFVSAFLILRSRAKRIYQPRTYVGSFPDS